MRQIDLSPSISRHPKKKRTLSRVSLKLASPVFWNLKIPQFPVIFDLFRLLWRYPKMMCAAVNYAADKSRIR
jgi:hypothetical protein